MEAKKILLVDDDQDFININKAILEKENYQVIMAYNGKECMEVLAKEKPDLIVLDVMMTHDTEGFDVAREIRNTPDIKDIPLIMLTSVNSEYPFNFEPDKTWLPVDVFLEKPVDHDKLIHEIKKATA